MEPRVSYINLGIANLERSVRFYEKVMGFPRLPSDRSVALFELGRVWLQLVPREQLAVDTGQAAEGTGFTGFTLSHHVHAPKEVDNVMASIERSGGRIVKKAETHGEHYSGFISDPDGIVWEIGFNPHYPHT